ncbi:hypothetical protein EE896_17345 [Pantoea eucalypti]|nr:hypothetical protein EE896_17345 [Pantoea eucalypti]
MRTEQPLWGRGVMVSPQHFQQQVAYAAWSAEGIARMGLSHPWGVINVAFESETLRLGRLQARHLHLRFPDGTLIDTDNADDLPPVLALEDESQDVVVVLALPLMRANGGNCLKPDEVAERPVRYRQCWRDISFELQARPAPQVVETQLTIDGQKLYYFNQMADWQSFRWPGDTYKPGTMLTWTTVNDFLLDSNTPLGEEAMDANSQLLIALSTDNEQESQSWKPDGLLYQDFLVMLRVYLGWRFKAKITLTTRTHLLAAPPLGDGPFWLGMNGVLGDDATEIE